MSSSASASAQKISKFGSVLIKEDITFEFPVFDKNGLIKASGTLPVHKSNQKICGFAWFHEETILGYVQLSAMNEYLKLKRPDIRSNSLSTIDYLCSSIMQKGIDTGIITDGILNKRATLSFFQEVNSNTKRSSKSPVQIRQIIARSIEMSQLVNEVGCGQHFKFVIIS